MSNIIVDVLKGGAVCLGRKVVCDGFAEGYPFRVQTHIHNDHMGGFKTSKGEQDIFMSPETHSLLDVEYNADIPYRSNIKTIQEGESYRLCDKSKLSLCSSNHILGGRQVLLELPSGLRIGYSSDFGFPLENIIKVDQLVVDSSYGHPQSVRPYKQSEAEERLFEIVQERLPHGSIHIKAFRGTIERVLEIVGADINVPILANEKIIKEVEIYQKSGMAMCELTNVNSEAGRSILNEDKYIRLYSKGDNFSNEPKKGTKIVCSAYMVNSDNPVVSYSEESHRVALSNHADFNEVMEYVKATGAEIVITDNTRGRGHSLADAIKEEIPNIFAQPSTNGTKPNWM